MTRNLGLIRFESGIIYQQPLIMSLTSGARLMHGFLAGSECHISAQIWREKPWETIRKRLALKNDQTFSWCMEGPHSFGQSPGRATPSCLRPLSIPPTGIQSILTTSPSISTNRPSSAPTYSRIGGPTTQPQCPFRLNRMSPLPGPQSRCFLPSVSNNQPRHRHRSHGEANRYHRRYPVFWASKFQ